MDDQVPDYELESNEKFKEIIETGIIPENITEEDAKLLYLELRKEAETLITTIKSSEETLNSLLNSVNNTANGTTIQLDAFMKALEIINSEE